MSILSLNKKVSSLMFLNDNVRQCLTIGYARLYVAHMNIIEIVEHCQYCRKIKNYQVPCCLNDNGRQCLTIGRARLSVAHTIYKIVNHCQYCR